MDELQARIKAMRSLQTESNLAKQPYLDLDELPGSQSEENVVGLPSQQRSTEGTPIQRSSGKRKQASTSKRKAQASTAKQKSVSFRQLLEVNQQPFADEVKRLEAQAERINQLLAERARKKTQHQTDDQAKGAPVDQSVPLGQSVPQSSQPQPFQPCPTSQKRGSKNSARLPHLSPRQEVLSMSVISDDANDSLEVRAERINQLVADLEATIAYGDAPSTLPPGEPVEEPESKGIETTNPVKVFYNLPQPSLDAERILSATASHPLSGQPSKPVDPCSTSAEQEAAETAEALRYLARRERYGPPGIESKRQTATRSDRYVLPIARRHSAQSRYPRSLLGQLLIQRYGLRLKQVLQIPQNLSDRIGDTVLWIVLAGVTRLGIRHLVAAFPVLSPIAMLLMLMPAALAVYLTIFVPKAGFASVYRLFLIMLGLLIGGKL